MKTWLLSALLASSLFTIPSQATDGDRLRDLVAVSDTGPGCALAVYRDGKMDRIVSSGLANIERSVELDGDSLFYAASVSKQFTALAVVQLAEQGSLSLDDNVREHIPELPAYRRPITLRMLLQHSSGIRDWLSLLRLGGHGPASDATMPQALELVLSQQDTNFVPDSDTTYSNGAFLLLAEVVARVSGERFADYVKRAILEPIGMTDSFVLDGVAPESDALAHGYVDNGSGFERRDTYPRFGGSGGLMLTLNDLARYEYDIEHGHRVWTPSVRRIMHAPGTLADGTPTLREKVNLAYAAGLMVGERRGYDVVQHGGGAEAFRHMYTRVSEHHLAVAVFCNHKDEDQVAQDMVDAAIDILLGPAPDYIADGPAPGRYRSDELRAQYLLERTGDALRLAIVPDGASDASSTLHLRRQRDGSYEGDGVELRADDDHDGFILETGRARGLHVHRVESD